MADAVVVVGGAPFVVPAAHLARAVATHLAWCRTNAVMPPASLVDLLGVLSGQEATIRDAAAGIGHGGLVTPSAVSRSVAAAKLGVSTRTVDRRIADGSLRALRLGRVVRIPLSALEGI